MAEDAGLTPFLGDPRAPVDAALRALLAPPEGAALRWTGAGDRLSIHLSGAPRTGAPSWALSLRLSPGPGRWSAAGYALEVIRPPRSAPDPLRQPEVRALLRRLVALFDDPIRAEGLIAAAVEARSTQRARGQLRDRFYRSIERGSAGRTGSLRLGFGCNQRCGFCWQDRRWPSPPEALYFTWLDELLAAGCEQISISGGEPTLSRSLPALIRRAADAGARVHLQTNAIRARRPGFAAGLVEAGLSSALVSLHSAEAARSDWMTRAPGTWRGTVAGIEALLGAGAFVAINCVVDTDNCDDLGAHAAFVVERFVSPYPENPVRLVNYSQPGDYHDAETFREKMAPLDRVRPQLLSAARRLSAAGVRLSVAGTCGFPLCATRGAPGIERQPREEMEPSHLEARTLDAETCRRCADRAWCPGVRRAYLERFGERGLEAG